MNPSRSIPAVGLAAFIAHLGASPSAPAATQNRELPSGPPTNHAMGYYDASIGRPVLIYDRARGTTILYGGIDGPKHDTWEWNGERWQQMGR